MPVTGVRVRDVVGNFGAPRGRRIHEGLDIMAPEGTEVYAAAAGTVAFAGRTALGGWTVQIEGDTRTFWYTHLQSIAPDLAEGVRVTPATLIGRVGRSGNAAGGPPHLHFEIVTAKGPVDPLPLLRDRF